MSSKSANTERKLSRLTMKNDQQLIETSKTLKPDQKTAIEENVLSCEISSICDRSKIKNIALSFPKTEDPSENMPHIRSSGSAHKGVSARKETTDKLTTSQQLSIGLSDLGTNSKLSLPARPLTTGRLLPHIGHKHLHKDSLTLLSKPPAGGGKSLDREAGGALTAKTQSEFQSKDSFRQVELEDSSKLAKPDQKTVQPVLSSLNVKSGYEDSGYILNPSNLNSFVVPKHTPAPPNRKPKRLLSHGSNKDFSSSCRETSSKTNSYNDGPSLVKRSEEKGIPGSNFKPIISVRNLELINHSKSSVKNRPFPSSVEELPGNRTLQSFSRLRQTHPPGTPPYSNKTLATVTTCTSKQVRK